MFENGKMTLNKEQMKEVEIGKLKGLDVSRYDNPFFDENQMREIRLGLENGIDLRLYVDEDYSVEQMREIRLGLENKVDVSFYAYDNFTVEEMKSIRENLEFEKNSEEIDVTIEKTLYYSIKYRVPKGLKGKELDNYIDELVSNEDFEYLKPIDSKITIK